MSVADLPAGDGTRTQLPAGVDCVVCDFVEASLDRSIFFLFAEGLGESWYFEDMRKGGFCLRHARRLSARGEGSRLTAGCREVLTGWAQRSADGSPDALLGRPCPVCATETWAATHALDLVAAGDPERARVVLGRLEPTCLRHLDALIDRVPWAGIPRVTERMATRIRQAEQTVGPDAAIAILAGRDPNDGARLTAVDDRPGDCEQPRAWVRRVEIMTPAALLAELEAGRCPACSAARDAGITCLSSIGTDDATVDDDGDSPALCRDHLFDALQSVTVVAGRAVRGSISDWRALTDALAVISTDPPPRLSAWTLVATARSVFAPASLVTERSQQVRSAHTHRCGACAAMIAASARTLALLGDVLTGPAEATRYERTDGLCARHLADAIACVEPALAALLMKVALTVSERIRWELDEAIRKSSWSVRYEVDGPETLAWKLALRFAVGDDVFATEHLATEPVSPRPTA